MGSSPAAGPEWDAKVHAAPPDQRRQALAEVLRVQHARLLLGNAVLQDIAEELKSNELWMAKEPFRRHSIS